jgi:hypothetical protein
VPGGPLIKQKIEPDSYGVDHWSLGEAALVRIRFISHEDWKRITKRSPPPPLDVSDTYRGWQLP